MTRNNLKLKSRTLSALAWSSSFKALSNTISFFIGILLARLLTPADFGLIGMTLVLTSFSQLLSNFGLSTAIIQKFHITESQINTCFWFSTTLGAALTVGTFLASNTIGNFFNNSTVADISQWMSLIFLFNSTTSIPRALLTKELEHKKLAPLEFIANLAGGATGIICAILGFTYWSLVAQQLIFSLSRSILLFFFAPFKLKFAFSYTDLKELFSYSGIIFVTQTLRSITLQLDKLLVGKFLDSQTLGLYSRAHQLVQIIITSTSREVANVIFPTFSKIQYDLQRVSNIYLKSMQSIALLTFPMMTGLYITAPEFIKVVLGDQWLPMTIYLRYFCFIGVIMSVSTITGTIYMALNKPGLQLKINLINQPLQIAGFIFGIKFGIIGMLSAYCLTYMISVAITWTTAARLLNITIFTILNSLTPVALPTFLMAGIILFLEDSLLYSFPPMTKLFLMVIIGTLTYTFFLHLVKPISYTELLKTIIKKINKTHPN